MPSALSGSLARRESLDEKQCKPLWSPCNQDCWYSWHSKSMFGGKLAFLSSTYSSTLFLMAGSFRSTLKGLPLSIVHVHPQRAAPLHHTWCTRATKRCSPETRCGLGVLLPWSNDFPQLRYYETCGTTFPFPCMTLRLKVTWIKYTNEALDRVYAP